MTKEEIPQSNPEEIKEDIKFKVELIETRIKRLSEALERVKTDDTLHPADQETLVRDANLELIASSKLIESIMQDVKKQKYD